MKHLLNLSRTRSTIVVLGLINHDSTLVFHLVGLIFVRATKINRRRALSHAALVSAIGALE